MNTSVPFRDEITLLGEARPIRFLAMVVPFGQFELPAETRISYGYKGCGHLAQEFI